MSVYGPYKTKQRAEKQVKTFIKRGFKRSDFKIVHKDVYYVADGPHAAHPSRI